MTTEKFGTSPEFLKALEEFSHSPANAVIRWRESERDEYFRKAHQEEEDMKRSGY